MGADVFGRLQADPRLQPRIPTATYRLQFHSRFTFEDARKLLPYLDALGVSDVYALSYLGARPGSMHGYTLVTAPLILYPDCLTARMPGTGNQQVRMIAARRSPARASAAFHGGDDA